MPTDIMALQVTDAQSWSFTSQGAYQAQADRRDLLGIIHPWAIAASGDFGMVERVATIPGDWKPPYRLRFYCCDDYANDDWRPRPDEWLGGEGFTGHRFKQALINGRVVWESDVADAEGPQVQTRFEVELPPECAPGASFRLALRVLDKVGSETRLPQDFHHTGATERTPEPPDKPVPPRFMTHVYWGDVLLLRGSVGRNALAPFERRPSEAVVERVREKRWPLPSFGATKRRSARLQLEMADQIPASGFPVTCGVPVPQGAVTALDQLALRSPGGEPVPLQAAVLNRWQDGSLRWALLDFQAPGGMRAGSWRLTMGNHQRPPAPPQPVRVRRRGRAVRITTGAIGITIGDSPEQLVDAIGLVGREPAAGPLTGEVIVRRGTRQLRYAPQADRVEVIVAGPLRATVEVAGRLRRDKRPDDSLGRFVFRLHAYAGQPIVRMSYRIFNDTARTLDISLLRLTLATGDESRAVWSGDASRLPPGEEIVIAQTGDGQFSASGGNTVAATGEHSQGWLATTTDRGTVMLAVRHFWQLFPKAVRAGAGELKADLFSPTDAMPFYQPVPGEAKRHELLLALLAPNAPEADARAIAAAFARPPRLFSAEWFCASGGLGYAAVHSPTEFDGLHRFMVKTYGDVGPTVLGGVPGLRSFPDAVYPLTGIEPGAWRNNYYDVMQGTLSEYLMSGDPRWFDRGEEQCLHVMDVDICHGRPDHPQWRGVLYGPSANHTGSWWAAMLRAEGMDTYYRLTGDPDAREAFLGVADFIAREEVATVRDFRHVTDPPPTGATRYYPSVRDQAGPFITLVRAYDETWDPKYLRAGRRVAHAVIAAMDLRRGCYSEVHGNYNYRGNIPWMVAQVMEPMYLYYRYSGDVEAAKALVGLAESIITENRTADGPGAFEGYSHNPHYRPMGSNTNILIAPAIGYAWELIRDPAFAAALPDAYHRTVADNTVSWIASCYWNTPTLLYYLKQAQRERRPETG